MKSPTESPPPSSSRPSDLPASSNPQSARDAALRDWVDQRAGQFGYDAASLAPASSDASFRRYFRVTATTNASEPASFIVMDAPPGLDDVRPFIRVAELLSAAGLRVPAVFDQDVEQGFLLLTDLGNDGYLDALRQADAAGIDALMRDAITALVQMQKRVPHTADLPRYDAPLLGREIDLFADWFVGKHAAITLDADQQTSLAQVREQLITAALAQPVVFVHRDFMPRNLMRTTSREPLGNPAILDFQDAVIGPICYDVVSMFRDAFISWDEERELDWVIRYWERARAEGLPVNPDFATFWRDYEWMGLQRHLKVLGIFCRLHYRDGKERYITDLPRFIHYARRTAHRYHALQPLLAIFDLVEQQLNGTAGPSSGGVGYTF